MYLLKQFKKGGRITVGNPTSTGKRNPIEIKQLEI